jgi:hypothetical protein
MIKLNNTDNNKITSMKGEHKMASNNNSGSNNIVVPEAKQALNQMKAEIANELGLTNYEQVDKGNLTARQNGYVGGYMTKRLVEMAQRQMSGTSGMQTK